MTAGRTFPRWMWPCAAVLVLLQLGGTVHLAAAPHGVCWEHGVVVDVDSASPAQLDTAAPARTGLERAPAPVVRSDAHPHCPALWVLRAARAEVAAAAAPVAGAIEHACIAAPEPVAAPGRWALRRAPKQSPPV